MINKNLSTTLLLLFLAVISSCSNDKAEEEEIEDYGETECINVELDLNQPLKWPFSEATKIIVHSFELDYENEFQESEIKDGNFILGGINGTVELNEKETLELYSVLHGTKTKRFGNTGVAYDCYEPHHSIVFYKENEPIEYLEVCIECDAYRTFKQTRVDFCDEKWCNLLHFFQSVGLTFTTGDLDRICK